MALWAQIVGTPSRIVTLGDAMDRYMREVAPLKAAATYRNNLREMRNLRAVFGHMRPDELRPPDIYAYLDTRKAPIAANREKASLSHVLRYAIRWGIANDNP
jgi:hypothetical protein